MERSEERALARRAMESLTERDRAMILMRTDGRSYDEIAATMAVQCDAVGTALARARKRLSDRFDTLRREREAEGSGIS